VWPTEPAKAGWSFNKWQKTRILKELRRRHLSNRLRSGPGRAAARAVVAAPADVVVVAVADGAAQVPVADAALPVDRVAVAVVRAAKAADVAARAAVDVAKVKVVTATVDVETVEASSSRT
jgi:hypothetical protein